MFSPALIRQFRPARAVGMGLVGLALLAGALDQRAALASYTIDGTTIKIWGTGRTANNSGVVSGNTNLAANQSIQENTWKLIAFPNAYINDTYDLNVNSGPLYIPSFVPSNWAGQAGTTAGNRPVLGGDAELYRWITYANWQASTASSFGVNPVSGYAQSYFTPGLSGPAVTTPLPVTYGQTPPDYYSYIAQTKFTPSKTGDYYFNTSIAADNFIEVYLGGSVTYDPNVVASASAYTPQISGGTKLTQLATNNGPGLFQNLVIKNTQVDNQSFQLVANQEYTLNYVIRDNAVNQSGADTFGSTGFIVASTSFIEVPGPLPVLGVGAFLGHARRLRRRTAGKVNNQLIGAKGLIEK